MTWILGRRRREQEDSNLSPIESVQRLDIQPGYTAILKLARPITHEQANELRRQWLERFPTTQALVLWPGIDLTIVRLTDEERDELLRKASTPTPPEHLPAVAPIDFALPERREKGDDR